MLLKFTKMHGAGNDFVVLDAMHGPIDLAPAQWRWLADRRFGVGADQILVVGPPVDRARADFSYRIFNADGGEVEQCGNGARAFARYVREKGLSSAASIRVETMSGVVTPTLDDDGEVTVDMGVPRFAPSDIPFDAAGLIARVEGDEPLWPLPLHDVRHDVVEVGVVSMGNPHAVVIVDDVDHAPVATLGPRIEHHPRFPKRVNAGFLEIVDRQTARLRVYERGAGETLACGSGACAAVVSGIRRGRLASPVTVHARGGVLILAWDGPGSSVRMRGPAVTVFEGEVDVPEVATSIVTPAVSDRSTADAPIASSTLETHPS
jgi:diaminopimelate epimerase